MVIQDLPTSKKAIGCKWVYKIKYNYNGTIEHFKAQLVILCNNQGEGIDFNETFTLVAKMVSICVFLAVAIIHSWKLHQIDVHNVFLQGDLDEEVYKILPPGFFGSSHGKVCQLCKSLYGLCQAPCNRFMKLAFVLKSFGFIQSYANYSFFSFECNDNVLNVLVYVDDLIIMGNNIEAIANFKAYLSACFYIKDLGVLKYFLG